MTDTNINIRIDSQLKADAYAIFEQIGVKPSEAMRMFLSQVSLHRGLPFEVKIPNAETLAAMKDDEVIEIHDIDEYFDSILEDVQNEKTR